MDGAFEVGKRFAERRSDLAWEMITGPQSMRLFPAEGDRESSQFMQLIRKKLEQKVIEGYSEIGAAK